MPAAGTELRCALRQVYDGDTVSVNCGDGALKVRVWGIDAAEMGQKPWGNEARSQLRALMPQADIRIQVMDVDRYGRAVARLYRGDSDVGLALVRQGGAAAYARYNDSPLYRRAEAEARRERLGIWIRPGPQQEPWAWRRVNPRG
jgi:endonuclease YncB( thermonuclease family)